MIRPFFPVFYLLPILLIPGCASPPFRPPTPYQRQPSINQENSIPGPPQSMVRPEDSLTRDIRRQADHQMQQGQLDAAAQTLERGLRISPKNAPLWSQLALVRLQQHRYGQAQALAAKSINLADGNRDLIRRNRQIISEAQQAQR